MSGKTEKKFRRIHKRKIEDIAGKDYKLLKKEIADKMHKKT